MSSSTEKKGPNLLGGMVDAAIAYTISKYALGASLPAVYAMTAMGGIWGLLPDYDSTSYKQNVGISLIVGAAIYYVAKHSKTLL